MSRPITSTEHGMYGFMRRTGCQCTICLPARRRYDKRMRMAQLRGESRRWDATAARAHVQQLIDQGATYYQIARASERVKETQIRRLMEGNGGRKVTWLFDFTVQALMRVTLERALSEESLRSAVGVQRRIEALTYMGHSMPDIANHLGVTDRCIWNYLQRKWLMTSTIAKMDGAYRELCMKPGTNERSKWRAYRSDFAPPMAWDEGTIDDPDAEPDRSGIVCVAQYCTSVAAKFSLCRKHYRRVSEAGGFKNPEIFRLTVLRIGRSRPNSSVETRAKIADLKSLGLTLEQAAARAGCGRDYVQQLWESA